MKKTILVIIIGLFSVATASAQVLPQFQFGAKAGSNFTTLRDNGMFTTTGQAGYIAGAWARVGALGLFFQPELYLTAKDVNITYAEGGNEVFKNPAKFTSVDVPLLVGEKIGAAGFGGRFYTGPVISFALSKVQEINSAALNYNDQNYAWQFGAGMDIQQISIDLRYEAGLNKLSYGPDNSLHTRINLFNLTLSYQIFSIF